MHSIRYSSGEYGIDTAADTRLILQSLTGLESVDVTDETAQSPRQDGKTLRYSSYEPRPFAIKIFVNTEDYDEWLGYRDALARVFDPAKTGVLTYTDGDVIREIVCKPEGGFSFPKNGFGQRDSIEIDMIAYDPLLYDPRVNDIDLTFWTGGLVFPLVFPITFRTKGETKLDVFVEGQKPAPLSIAFKGPAVTPKVLNNRTGEFIEVNATLTSDQTLHITTGFKQESVKIEENGIYTDAYAKINIESDFFLLQPGHNLLEYMSGEDSPSDVSISYMNRYVGI